MALSVQDEWILSNRIAVLVTHELIARLRANPEPPYDSDIAEVLDFVRRNPDPDLPRYVIVEKDGQFAIAARGRPPSDPPRLIDDVRYPSRRDAEAAVIEQRLRDYGIQP
jgi:hypothetical protein